MRLPRHPLARSLALLLLLPGAGLSQVGSPAGPVPPEFLEARRDALMDLLDGKPALLSGARARDLESDYAQDSDFRQENDFFYLTGLEVPGAWLLLNGREPGDAVLYLPPRSPSSEQWTGPALGPGPEAAALTGVAEVRSLERLRADVQAWLSADGDDAGRDPGASAVYLSLGDTRDQEVVGELLPSAVTARSLNPLLAHLRQVKDEEELRRLRKAVAITADAHREVWRAAEPGMAEYEAEAVLEYVFRVQGAERVGFPSIVGSGPNSVILHYDENRRTMEAGDLVVVDIGAEYGYYTADLTRTFPVGGRFTPRQKELYDLVLGAQEAALEALRPGSTVREMEGAARTYLRDHSRGLCGAASCEHFFVHGLSHWLGMDVHDVGDYARPLEPGMVLTVEPGLYLPEEGVGIRIEDDVLVTDSGHEVLSRDLPRSTEEIEAIMREEPVWVRFPARER